MAKSSLSLSLLYYATVNISYMNLQSCHRADHRAGLHMRQGRIHRASISGLQGMHHPPLQCRSSATRSSLVGGHHFVVWLRCPNALSHWSWSCQLDSSIPATTPPFPQLTIILYSNCQVILMHYSIWSFSLWMRGKNSCTSTLHPSPKYNSTNMNALKPML